MDVNIPLRSRVWMVIVLFNLSVAITGCNENKTPKNTVINNNVITVDDVEVMVDSFNHFSGSTRYRRNFNDLTTEQIEILTTIDFVEDSGDCWTDSVFYEIEFVNSDGESRMYYANSENALCHYPPEYGDKLISVEAIGEFTKTYDCLSAGETRNSGETVEEAFYVEANDGCEHAFFDGPTWLRVNVDHIGTYTFRGIECGYQNASFELYAEDGETIISSGEGEVHPGCWAIEHTFDNTGFYYLRVDGTMGDYFLRITSDK